MKIKHIWNHHLDIYVWISSTTTHDLDLSLPERTSPMKGLAHDAKSKTAWCGSLHASCTNRSFTGHLGRSFSTMSRNIQTLFFFVGEFQSQSLHCGWLKGALEPRVSWFEEPMVIADNNMGCLPSWRGEHNITIQPRRTKQLHNM